MYSYLFWIFTKTSIYEISSKTEKPTKLGEILYPTLPQECNLTNFLILFTKKTHKFARMYKILAKISHYTTLPQEILVKFVTSYVMKFFLVTKFLHFRPKIHEKTESKVSSQLYKGPPPVALIRLSHGSDPLHIPQQCRLKNVCMNSPQ
jgi:hypothetical protein